MAPPASDPGPGLGPGPGPGPGPEHLATALSGLFGGEIAVAVVALGDVHETLFAEEAAAMRRALAPRRAEFAAGRQAARTALAQIGAPRSAIAMQPDRSPRWPAGFTGSISHSAGLAAAVCAPSPPVRALGLDLEPDTPLERALWPDILTAREQNWLQTRPADRPEHLAKQLFCIKEAAYKAQYTLSATLLDFTALCVSCDTENGRFSAVFQGHYPPFSRGDTLAGRFVITNGLIMAGLTL